MQAAQWAKVVRELAQSRGLTFTDRDVTKAVHNLMSPGGDNMRQEILARHERIRA